MLVFNINGCVPVLVKVSIRHEVTSVKCTFRTNAKNTISIRQVLIN